MTEFKVGDRVLVEAVVKAATPADRSFPFKVAIAGASYVFWPHTRHIHPVPEARAPWVVLREAADILEASGDGAPGVINAMRQDADRLEAAAAPKPPTLREAAQAWVDLCEKPRTADDLHLHEAAWKNVKAALAAEKERADAISRMTS